MITMAHTWVTLRTDSTASQEKFMQWIQELFSLKVLGKAFMHFDVTFVKTVMSWMFLLLIYKIEMINWMFQL